MHAEGLSLNCRVYASLRKPRPFLWVSSFLIVLFCLQASQLIVQSSVWNEWHTKHKSNTNSKPFSRRGRQLFNNFAFTIIQEKIAEVSVPLESICP